MNIGCFGTFNIDNYGDILLGEINSKNFSDMSDEFDISLFSPDYENNLIHSDANVILADNMAERNLDAIVIGGGDLLTLAPTDEHVNNSISPFSASQWNWLLPATMAKVNNLPLVINAPGVPYEFSEPEKKIISYLHGEKSYVTARDPISAGYLSDALGRDVPVIPDPAFILPEIYDSDELEEIKNRIIKKAGIPDNEPYACIQCSPGFLGKDGKRFLDAVVEAREILGIHIVMLPICYLWGDLDACKEVSKISSIVKSIDYHLTVKETASLIKGSRWFAGSSLHGCLTSMAFGKSALLITLNELTKFKGASELYKDGLITCSNLDDFVGILCDVNKMESSKVELMATECRQKVKQHFKDASEFISQNQNVNKTNGFHYDKANGNLSLSDTFLQEMLTTQQLHYLQSKLKTKAKHQKWLGDVIGSTCDELEAISAKKEISAKSVVSIVNKISMAGNRGSDNWFNGYSESRATTTVDILNNKAEEKMVSIIVPAYNCWDLTKACVDSIRKFTLHNYELILIDDASDADVAEKMAALKDDNTVIIRNETRCSFSINNNKAAKIAKGDAVCLLNNDTLVTPGWLKPMVNALEKDDSIGVVGNKHLFPDTEKLHHCGMAYDKKSYPWHLHPHTDPNAPSVNYDRDVPCVTFACVLIGIKHYRELNGLDEEFRNGFEDCDFCMRSTASGKRIVYAPASVIYHYGQSSPGRTDYENANWLLFEKRWKDKTKNKFKEMTKADRKWNKRVAKGKHSAPSRKDGIHFAIDFSQGGAFTWAAADLIDALIKRGENVSVMPSLHMPGVDKSKRKLLRKLMRKKPCGAFHIKWSHYWKQHMKTPMAGDINAEFFCTNYRYQKENRRLDLWMRHVQSSNHHWLPISGFNLDALEDVGIDSEKCSVMPLGYAPEVEQILPGNQPRAMADNTNLNLLMITNSADLQRYGTDIAIRAFGRAYSASDNVTLHIKDYGAYTGSIELKEWIAKQPQFPKVVWHIEFLDKIELMKLYAEMDALVAPFRGEGFGMKIIDAMALGVPVLMPLFGGAVEYTIKDGYLPLDFKKELVGDCFDMRSSYIGKGAYWCEVDEDSLVKQLKSISGRKDELAKIGQTARDYVRTNYSWDNAAERLMLSLRKWQVDREETVATRRQVSTSNLTVIIPTLNREDILGLALDAYRKQDLSPEEYELLIVNDHGDIKKVNDTIEQHGHGLNIRVLDNQGLSGPAAARNLAIEESRGDIILITGDDIIPEKDFLSEHLKIHKSHPGEHVACVGNTQWHPDLNMTPFMRHLSGEGGQQFNYRDSKQGREVPFDRFYTSNVSIKRSFLIEEESLFLTIFRFAAYEDVELAYRLHLRGMKLLHSEKAIGYHHHEMTPESFVKRQKLVGRMLTLMSLVQPSYVPTEHTAFLESLEYACSDINTRKYLQDLSQQEADDNILTGDLVTILEQVLNILPTLNASGREGVRAEDALKHSQWLSQGSGPIWDAINELVLREGMAEEWAENGEDPQWAKTWIRMISLRSILKDKKPILFSDNLMPPKSALTSILGSPQLFMLINKLISLPLVGAIISRMMRSRIAEMIKLRLKR